MATVKAWLLRFRWVGWIVLAAVIGVVTLVLRRMFAGTSEADRARFQMPTVPPAVLEKVAKAEETALVARIEATTVAETKKEELVQVLAIPDADNGGAERRKRLAAMLKALPP